MTASWPLLCRYCASRFESTVDSRCGSPMAVKRLAENGEMRGIPFLMAQIGGGICMNQEGYRWGEI